MSDYIKDAIKDAMNGNAVSFKENINSALSEKVVGVLDALKPVVANKMLSGK